MIALFVNNARVDLEPDTDVRLTYTIETSREPGERGSGFSTTIRCPFTPNNQQAFGYLDNIEVGEANRYGAPLDRSARNPARIEADGVTVFRGEAILERVTAEGFEVYVSGQDAPWQASLDRPMREILAQDYGRVRTWEAADVLAERFNDGARPSDRWLVPLVDYGRLQSQLTTNVAELRDLVPYTFVRQLLRLCFLRSGYEQLPDFFSRMNASGLLLSPGEFNHVEGQPFDDLPSPNALIVRGASDGDNDNVGGYPLAANATSSAVGGSYQILGEYVRVRFKLEFTADVAAWDDSDVDAKGFQLGLYRTSDIDAGANYWFGRLIVAQNYRMSFFAAPNYLIYAWRMGTAIDPPTQDFAKLNFNVGTGRWELEDDFVIRTGVLGSSSSEFFSPFRRPTPNTWQPFTPVISAGRMDLGFTSSIGTFFFDGTPSSLIEIVSCQFFLERAEEQDYRVKPGQAFSELSVLPPETTGLELLAEVCKMFNLLVETDVVRRTVRLLPRDEFYESQLSRPPADWSAKVNTAESYERTFLNTEHPTALDFKFADADDADTERADVGRITPTGGARWESGQQVGEDPGSVEVEYPAVTEFSYTIGSPVTHRIIAARMAPEPSPASVEPQPSDTPRIAQLCTFTRQDAGDIPLRLITAPGYAGDPLGNTYGNAPTARALSQTSIGEFSDSTTRVARIYDPLRFGDTLTRRGLLKYYDRQLERVKTGSRLTINVVLSIADVVGFTFRRAVRLLNKLWDVERIDQFDPTGFNSTEVELVSHIDVPPPALSLAQVEFFFEHADTVTQFSFRFRIVSPQVSVGPTVSTLEVDPAVALLDLQNQLRAAGLIALCWVERYWASGSTGRYRVRVGFPLRPVGYQIEAFMDVASPAPLTRPPSDTILTTYSA